MTRLYGTITSDKGTATRTSHHSIIAAAQSFDGSVAVTLYYVLGDAYVDIDADNGSTATPGRSLYSGRLDELIRPAVHLVRTHYGEPDA